MRILIWFVKITGIIPQLFYYKKKVIYLDKNIKKRKSPAILVSNHTAVMDFGLYFFIFLKRTLIPLAAEVLYKKKLMTIMLKMIGAIRVDRDKYDFSFIEKSVKKLSKNQDILIFPESKVSVTKEVLEFKPSFIEIALEAGVPVIPMYTTGNYPNKTYVVIGKKINILDLYDQNLSKVENLKNLSNYVRDCVKELEVIANAYKK